MTKALANGETLVALELTKEKLAIQEKQLSIINKSSDLIPKIERNVESIINLRDKVENPWQILETVKTILKNILLMIS